MDLIFYYYIFAIATGLAAMYELVLPVLGELEVSEPENPVVQYLKISKLTFLLVMIIGAPVFFLSCIIPSFAERFRNAFLNALSDVKI